MNGFMQIHTDIQVRCGHKLSYPAHLHSYAELVYIWQGESRARIDGKEYILSAGDLLLISPNCVHSFEDTTEGKYLCAIFSCDSVPTFRDELRNRAQAPTIKNGTLPDSAKVLLALLSRKGREQNEWFSGVMTALLSEVLPLIPNEQRVGGDGVREILNFCLSHYREPITLADISKELHISTSRLSHIFKEKIGLSFKYYINYLRVREACARLGSTEESISNIALSCGFESIRSFNRNFNFIMGVAPKVFRARSGEQELLM